MAFFEGVGRKISQSGQAAAQKAKNMAETVRLNGLIADEEKRISAAYLQIGKAYCESLGENPGEPFARPAAEIADAKAKIAAYAAQLDQIKGTARCPKCGAEVSSGARFCNSCGSPLNVQPSRPAETGAVCAKCGAKLAAGELFCTNCGSRAEEPAPEPVPEPAERACPACGAKAAADAVFCPECGQKL